VLGPEPAATALRGAARLRLLGYGQKNSAQNGRGVVSFACAGAKGVKRMASIFARACPLSPADCRLIHTCRRGWAYVV
jgi:hypothetical protein